MSKKGKAQNVVGVLKLMGNESRLLMLCRLCEVEEVSASDLVSVSGCSQPAGSQHLSVLRGAGVIDYRRERNILYYFLVDKNVKKIIDLIYKIYCDDG